MNIGIIGFGNMGKTHAYAINSLKYFYSDIDFDPVLYGVSASSYESARRYAEMFGFSRAFSSSDELINCPEIDVVDICTPNIFHYEQLKAAISAGKNIYCEKPLTISKSQSLEIAALAREKKATCGIVFNNRFLLPVMKAKEIIEDGKIGKIISFNFSYLHSSAMNTGRTGWKQDKDICGGGTLVDLGSHAVDLALHLCGEISSVYGKSQVAFPVRRSVAGKENWSTNADEAFYMTATLESGAVGQITISKVHSGTNDDLTFEIYGEKGALRFSLMEPSWLYYYDGNSSSLSGFTKVECVGRYPLPATGFPGIKAPVGWLRGHIGSMHNFLRCATDNKTPAPSFDDAARVQCVIDAAYKSDLSKTEEKVSYT